MAFGDINAGVIMFIAVTVTTVILAGVFSSQINLATSSGVQKQQHLSKQMRTDIVIEHVYYDNNQVIAYLKNSGGTAMRPGTFTIFVNNDFFKATGTNSSVDVVDDTDTQNTEILDPHEVVQITTNITLDSDAQHTYRVITQYNTKHSKIFTT